MKSAMLLLGALAHMSTAHEIEGILSRNQATSHIARTIIPFDSFQKTEHGRIYTLWIAPDGALVLEIAQPWVAFTLSTNIPAPTFRMWIVTTQSALKLPQGFVDLPAGAKGQLEEAEELTGQLAIEWRHDADYSMRLDVTGAKGRYAFTGHLYGNSRNKPLPPSLQAGPSDAVIRIQRKGARPTAR